MISVLRFWAESSVGAPDSSEAGSTRVAMRVAEVVLAMPLLPLLILISSMYRPPVWQLAMFVGLFSWPGISRLIRGEVMSDQTSGVHRCRPSDRRIQYAPPDFATSSRTCCRSSWSGHRCRFPSLILLEAILSYLGVGVRPPTPSWGNMLEEAQQFYRTSWWLIFIPGFAIYITVLSMTLTGNGIRDAIDVRLPEKIDRSALAT